MAYFIALPVCVLFSFFFCLQRRKGFSVSNLILKTISSVCFLLTAALALLANSGSYVYGALVIMGGILGLVGDILLDLKGIYKQDEHTYLMGGFIAFLIGHIFYSSAIIYQSHMKWQYALICVAVAVVFSIGNNATSKIMKMDFGKYKLIVGCYVVFLALTMALSIVAVITSGFNKAYITLAAGSVLFTLSDVVLSGTYFGEGKDTGFYYFINHFLYYAGQYLIAASILLV